MPRVVSLIPSATEIVCALGFESDLVGRSHECDYPEAVKRLPACTTPKLPLDGTSYEIDARVKAIVQEGLSVYRVDGERLRALRPDVVVTQSQCEVCAASLEDVARAISDWVEARPRLVSLAPNALADVWRDIAAVAEALAVPERGTALAERLRQRIATIARRAEALSGRPRVACVEWLDPLMAAGNWVPELVSIAGGDNLFGEAGKHSPWMSWEALVECDPDVIVFMPCGFDIDRTRRDLPLLVERLEWSRLRAVTDSRVAIADGNQFFNRPGPRLVESLEILAEILHPEIFRFGHEGVGWVRLR